VPIDGRPLLDWLAEWTVRPDKADNLSRLAASNAEERHLFLVLPSFAEAPFAVTDLLSRDGGSIPDADPETLARQPVSLYPYTRSSRSFHSAVRADDPEILVTSGTPTRGWRLLAEHPDLGAIVTSTVLTLACSDLISR
jgi:hypothetical protein